MCVRNGRLGPVSGPLAAANIRDHCTSGVAYKTDIHNFSLKVREVLYSDVPVQDAIVQFTMDIDDPADAKKRRG